MNGLYTPEWGPSTSKCQSAFACLCSYHWNAWALRRQVLKLANLQSKATHSAQTATSGFRRHAETQYWVPKTSTSQTPYGKGQSMAKKLRYIKGLRGDPVSTKKMNVVSLELDLGQPHQY